MNKRIFFTSISILAFSLLSPQVSFSLCPEINLTGLTFSEEFIYWVAREEGLGFSNKHANVLTTDNFTKKATIKPQFKWQWGFRLGVNYTKCDSPWTFQAYWTYLKSKAHGNKRVNSGEPDFKGIYPIWSMADDTLSGDYVSSASSHWHLYTNIIDFNIQHHFSFFCNKLNLRPFLGIRGTSLYQKQTAKYAGGSFFSGEDVNHLRSRYLGAGPRIGLNFDYSLNYGFSIIGRAAVAPLFGSFHIKQREVYLDNVRLHRSRDDHHLVLSTDYQLGIKWKGCIIENLPPSTLGIAWDVQEFYGANRFFRGKYHFFSKNRDLFLQGLTLSTAIDF